MRSRERCVEQLALAVMLLLAPGVAGAAERHSGTILKVDGPGRMIVLEELGIAGVRRELSMRLEPDARIVVSERAPEGAVADLAQPFRDTPVDLQAVRPGDFVVVESAATEGTKTARALTVTLRRTPGDVRR
jgi:hypothetical protein